MSFSKGGRKCTLSDNPFRIEDIMMEVDKLTTNNTAAKLQWILPHDRGNIIGQPWWKIWGFNPG